MSSMNYKCLHYNHTQILRDWIPLDIPHRHFHRTFCGRLDRAFHKIFVPHVFGLIQDHAASYDSFVLPTNQRNKQDVASSDKTGILSPPQILEPS